MKIINNKIELQHYIAQLKSNKLTIGFAPTMGALHDGHISLYKIAKQENDRVVASIFVNPTQFNNPEDLKKYPRTVDQDIEKLEQSNLVDAVYIPSIEDIYPETLESQHYNFNGLENQMEGAARPGHFDGVGTVVETLLRQVNADKAYFGEKDYQQLKIIETLVKNLELPIDIYGVPIHRQENGLAMSSRNMRLSEDERENAAIIYKTLTLVNDWFHEVSIPEIKKRVEDIFNKESNMALEYFLIADEETLKEANYLDKSKSYRAFIVVNVGAVRLIDNMHLD